MRRSLLPLALVGLLGLAVLPGTASAAHGTLVITGLTASDRLVELRANDPGTVLRSVPIRGVVGDVQSLDFRVATGALYALAVAEDGGRLYTVDTTTGAATPVAGAPLLPIGDRASIDVNPAADALRIVDASGTNLRLRFSDNALFTDGRLGYVEGDENAGEPATVGGVAYTDNDTVATTATTLYDLDAALGVLALQAPPNAGGLQTVGALPQRTKAQATGFDIYSRTNGSGVQWAFVSLFDKGRSTLYEIDLATGAAKGQNSAADPASGTVIGTTPHVTDIAVRPEQGL